jgi:hypothetical protein
MLYNAHRNEGVDDSIEVHRETTLFLFHLGYSLTSG